MLKKIISKQLCKLYECGLPFEYKLTFVNEDTDSETETFEGSIIYFDFTINRYDFPDIDVSYLNRKIYLSFNQDYPMSPPVVYYSDGIIHPSVIDVDGLLCLSDWCPAFDLRNLFGNIYCIYLEYLESLSGNLKTEYNKLNI